jgi:hypothetical protein
MDFGRCTWYEFSYCLLLVYHILAYDSWVSVDEDWELSVGSFLSIIVGSILLLAYGLKLHQHGFVFYGLETHHMAMHLHWLAAFVDLLDPFGYTV